MKNNIQKTTSNFHPLPQAVPSQQWRKADPLFMHSLTTRNMHANPLHTVFGVQAKKVLEESRQVGKIQGCDRYKDFGSPNQIQNQIGLVLLVLTDTKI